MVFQMFGVMWVMPSRLKDCLVSWRGQKGNSIVIQIWRIAPLCVLCCLWRERNGRDFEDCQHGIIELKKRVLQTLLSWRVLWHSSQVSTFAL